VAFIHREFLVDFDQLASLVENFLPEAHCIFTGIHLFEIARPLTQATGHVQLIASAAGW
jgi:hypothetical protein